MLTVHLFIIAVLAVGLPAASLDSLRVLQERVARAKTGNRQVGTQPCGCGSTQALLPPPCPPDPCDVQEMANQVLMGEDEVMALATNQAVKMATQQFQSMIEKEDAAKAAKTRVKQAGQDLAEMLVQSTESLLSEVYAQGKEAGEKEQLAKDQEQVLGATLSRAAFSQHKAEEAEAEAKAAREAADAMKNVLDGYEASSDASQQAEAAAVQQAKSDYDAFAEKAEVAKVAHEAVAAQASDFVATSADVLEDHTQLALDHLQHATETNNIASKYYINSTAFVAGMSDGLN